MKIVNKDVDTDLSSNYIIITGLVISIAGVIVSLTLLFFTNSSASIPIRNYAHEIFVLFSSSFSPLLMALLILCFPVKLSFDRYLDNKNKNKNKLPDVSKNTSNNSNNKDNRARTISRTKIIFYLSLFMVLSATMTLILHLPSVNKDNRPVGADIQDYTTAIKHLSSYSNNP